MTIIREFRLEICTKNMVPKRIMVAIREKIAKTFRRFLEFMKSYVT